MRGDILQVETEVRFHVESDNGEFVTYGLRMRSGRAMKNNFGELVEPSDAPEPVEIPEPDARAVDWGEVAEAQCARVFGLLAPDVDDRRREARAGRSEFFSADSASDKPGGTPS